MCEEAVIYCHFALFPDLERRRTSREGSVTSPADKRTLRIPETTGIPEWFVFVVNFTLLAPSLSRIKVCLLSERSVRATLIIP
jgi:hypothetical protein